jgi:hypothetical protein
MKRPSHIWWCRYNSMDSFTPKLQGLLNNPKLCPYYHTGICKHSLNLKPDDKPCNAKKYRLVPESSYRVIPLSQSKLYRHKK